MTNNEMNDLTDSQYMALLAEKSKWAVSALEYCRLLSIVEKLQNYDSRALLDNLRKR